MSVTEHRNSTQRNVRLESELRLGSMTATLTGAFTVGKTFPPLLMLDPGGAARTVTLPAEADSKGLMFVIVNLADAAEDLTVQDDTPATVGTVSQNEAAMFFCDGVRWRSLVGGNT